MAESQSCDAIIVVMGERVTETRQYRTGTGGKTNALLVHILRQLARRKEHNKKAMNTLKHL